MRALVLVVLAVAGGCDLDAWSGSSKPAPTATTTRAPARPSGGSDRARDDCRDACEQGGILQQTGDEALRACRAACDGKYGGGTTATNPYEAPSRITRAPARSHPPAVRPR